ncbi:hypothetical protein [Mycobacterium sp. URHB0044]|uniref:hypothetical protein n=1 Tax=Mycobacterium sp. URHB0044 TaxID=1380386 RepID=UPI001E4D0455|nr:hypothetical protein [Mycobacterium sp. URHB0044]
MRYRLRKVAEITKLQLHFPKGQPARMIDLANNDSTDDARCRNPTMRGGIVVRRGQARTGNPDHHGR